MVRGATPRPNLRTAAEVEALMAGVDLLPPGLVPLHRWRPRTAVPETGPARSGPFKKVHSRGSPLSAVSPDDCARTSWTPSAM
ncbi:SAM-dependent methyltransferase [Actinomadura monticuli]|uniref:SAM-dependent methyltransferase n=1 Tax=Actinomadura monticuli TaxID=3097367 RepID=UPI003561702F